LLFALICIQDLAPIAVHVGSGSALPPTSERKGKRLSLNDGTTLYNIIAILHLRKHVPQESSCPTIPNIKDCCHPYAYKRRVSCQCRQTNNVSIGQVPSASNWETHVCNLKIPSHSVPGLRPKGISPLRFLILCLEKGSAALGWKFIE
jgi:hypothetical protein